MRYAHTKHVCVHLQDRCFTQESQSGEFKTKRGTWKYLKVSLRNSRSCKCSHWFQMAATLLKATSHLHISKACIMQSIVLPRASHPLIQGRDFFCKDASLPPPVHPSSLCLDSPSCSGTAGGLSLTSALGNGMANCLVEKQNQWCFIWVIHVDLTSVSLFLCFSHFLATKDKLL